MKSLTEQEIADIRRDVVSAERRAAFRSSAEAVAQWKREHPIGLSETLDSLAQIQAIFGSLPADREPWCGDDFRL